MGEWRYCSIKFVVGTGVECLVSCPWSFTPGDNAPSSLWIGGSVGPRACIDSIKKREIHCFLPGIEPASSSP
jgi:hypothetical protein